MFRRRRPAARRIGRGKLTLAALERLPPDTFLAPITRELFESVAGEWSKPVQMMMTAGDDGLVRLWFRTVPAPDENVVQLPKR